MTHKDMALVNLTPQEQVVANIIIDMFVYRNLDEAIVFAPKDLQDYYPSFKSKYPKCNTISNSICGIFREFYRLGMLYHLSWGEYRLVPNELLHLHIVVKKIEISSLSK